MLSAYQCEVVAWENTWDGELVCDKDVRLRVRNDVWLERVKRGLDEHPDWTPVIRYSVDEWRYESQCPTCEQPWEQDVCCAQCGAIID